MGEYKLSYLLTYSLGALASQAIGHCRGLLNFSGHFRAAQTLESPI